MVYYFCHETEAGSKGIALREVLEELSLMVWYEAEHCDIIVVEE